MSAVLSPARETYKYIPGYKIVEAGIIVPGMEIPTQRGILTKDGHLYVTARPNIRSLKQAPIDALSNTKTKPPTEREVLQSLKPYRKQIPQKLRQTYESLLHIYEKNYGMASAAGRSAQSKRVREFLYELNSKLPQNNMARDKIEKYLLFNTPKSSPSRYPLQPRNLKSRYLGELKTHPALGLTKDANMMATQTIPQKTININSNENHLAAKVLLNKIQDQSAPDISAKRPAHGYIKSPSYNIPSMAA